MVSPRTIQRAALVVTCKWNLPTAARFNNKQSWDLWTSVSALTRRVRLGPNSTGEWEMASRAALILMRMYCITITTTRRLSHFPGGGSPTHQTICCKCVTISSKGSSNSRHRLVCNLFINISSRRRSINQRCKIRSSRWKTVRWWRERRSCSLSRKKECRNSYMLINNKWWY